MHQKGFSNIILAIVIVILIGTVGYFAFVKKSEPVVQQPTPTSTPTATPSQTDTSFKILSPKVGDSWKIGETYFVKFQNLPKGSFAQGWLQNKNEADTGTASIGIIETGRDGNPSSNVQITVPSQWCGGECGAVQYVTPGQYRLILLIYPGVHDPSYETFYSDYLTLTSN